MNMSEITDTGETTAISLASIRHVVDTGQRPEGYIDDYYEAALEVDEENELLWITREQQDRLIRKYRTDGAPDTTGAKRDASKIRKGFEVKEQPLREDGRKDYTNCQSCKEKMLEKMR